MSVSYKIASDGSAGRNTLLSLNSQSNLAIPMQWQASQRAQLVNAIQWPQFNSWVRKFPGRRDRLPTPVFLGFPCGSAGRIYLKCGQSGFDSWVGKILWRRERLPTPVFWPGEFHSQGYGFSCGHIWMWELDYKESWALKNWCFWTVVLEKTLESPLDCKEIQSVHPKRDQSWVLIGRTDVDDETPIIWLPDVKS